jgi:DNA-directed RNA polymerase specialized sigma24 family protein
MASNESVSHWLNAAKTGSEPAAQMLWERYFEQLVRLARKKLGDLPRRAVDEEDVALSAFDSFYQGIRQGRFPKIDDRDNLWRLLVVITARKASDYRQHANRQKRGGGRTVGESVFVGTGDSEAINGLGQIVGREPTPEFAAQVVEQFQRLIQRFPDGATRRLMELKLDGYMNDEIAVRLEVTTRTIERKLRLIRSVLEEEFI